MSVFDRINNESDSDYLYRIGSMKEAGVIAATWPDLAEL